MKLNTILLSVTFLTTLYSLEAFSASRNDCDDLIDAKKSDIVIEKCIKRLGPSETYIESMQKKKWQDAQSAIKETEDAAKKANIETKKFDEKEIEEELGMPIYAYRVEYSRNPNGVPEELTKGDTLCKFLKFEKSLKSRFSGYIEAVNAYQNGYTIDDYWIGNSPKEPELFKDKSVTYRVLKFKEITCAKIISKDVPGTKDLLKSIVEDIGDLSPNFIEGKIAVKESDEDKDEEDNSPRKSEKKSKPTPFEYVRKKDTTSK